MNPVSITPDVEPDTSAASRRQLYDIGQAVEWFGYADDGTPLVSESRLRKLTQAGAVPFRRGGRRRTLFTPADLAAVLEYLAETPRTAPRSRARRPA